MTTSLRLLLGGSPLGLIGMIALILPVEAYVSRRGMDFLDADDMAYRHVRHASAREARTVQVLCLGDSLMKYGVAPRAVRDRSGLSAYNLALPGGLAPASYYVLRRAVDSGARPSAVVVDFFAPLLGKRPDLNRTRWPGLLGMMEAADLAWNARDPGLWASILLARFPSIRGRESIRANIHSALNGRADGRIWGNALVVRNWSKNDGAQMMPPSGSTFTTEKIEEYGRGFYDDWRCDPINTAYIDRFLTLADVSGIPVYWLIPPVAPALQKECERLGFDARFSAFVRAWQDRFPGLIVVDGRASMCDPGAFHDPNHLSGPGAYAFSQALGDVIQRQNADRWIELGPLSPCKIPDGMEDLDASILALKKMKETGRW